MQSDGRPIDFEAAIGELSAAYFFREFTFSKNTFKPNPNDQLELADTVVWLDDFLIVSQLKERNAPSDTTTDKERAWFKNKILKDAVGQIRDSLSYLKAYPQIEVRNNRGHVFNIASAEISQIHKLVIYQPHELLPTECAFRKYHRSAAAGLIHLMHSAAYLDILQLLVTPVEIAEYLTFRQGLVDKWGEALSMVSERAVVGQYLRNLPEEKPSVEFLRYVNELEQKDNDWDISRIIHLFPERKNTPSSSQETGYKVLKELAKLYRTEMAEFKKRFRFSMQKAVADEPSSPNRFTSSKGCGFVFIPLQRKDLPYRGNLLLNFTELNKYDQKLNKCVGLTFIAEGTGSWCDVQWCPMEFSWKENSKLREALDKNYPFSPIKARVIERYGLSDAPKID